MHVYIYVIDMETLHLPFPGQGTTKLRRNSKVRPVACLVPWSFAKAQVPDAKCWISASWGTLGWDPGIQCCFCYDFCGLC